MDDLATLGSHEADGGTDHSSPAEPSPDPHEHAKPERPAELDVEREPEESEGGRSHREANQRAAQSGAAKGGFQCQLTILLGVCGFHVQTAACRVLQLRPFAHISAPSSWCSEMRLGDSRGPDISRPY